MCIDNVEKRIEFVPKYKDMPWNSRLTKHIAHINDSSFRLQVINELKPNEPEVPHSIGRLQFISKETPNFPDYALEYLEFFAGAVPIRVEHNTIPDLNWFPKFKKQFTFEEAINQKPPYIELQSE